MVAVSAQRHAVRLYLKAHGLECVGHPRDEAVVDGVAHFLVDVRHADTHTHRGEKRISRNVEALRRKDKPFSLPDVIDP